MSCVLLEKLAYIPHWLYNGFEGDYNYTVQYTVPHINFQWNFNFFQTDFFDSESWGGGGGRGGEGGGLSVSMRQYPAVIQAFAPPLKHSGLDSVHLQYRTDLLLIVQYRIVYSFFTVTVPVNWQYTIVYWIYLTITY